MVEGPSAQLVAAILDVARTSAAATPPPRGLPYLGLEHPSGTGLHLLEALSTRGIFRKYEQVLDLDAGLGATSRWLVERLGCTVVGTSGSPAEARIAAELTRRARLQTQAHVVSAPPSVLPFPDARFTHVWILEALPRIPAPASALAEAHRVLRRGGLVAVQDLVADGAVGLPGLRFATAVSRATDLRAAGFVDLELHDRTPEAAERSAQVTAARVRLRRALTGSAREFLARWDALAALVAAGRVHVVQMLARRP